VANPRTTTRPRPKTASPAHRPSDPSPPAADEGSDAGERPHGRRVGIERIALAMLSTLVGINLWTGGPLLAMWVGSRIQEASGQLTMSAVGATLGVLIATTLILYRLLVILNARYNSVMGRPEQRVRVSWLKPMSGERKALERGKRPVTVVERVVIVSVVLAVQAAVVWFFFFAHCTLYCGG
jgi:hypothetical protein